MGSCHALIRVRVPDRPGALGLVASRIGALKSDIIGISVLDRADGSALDELAVVIPDADLIPALAHEIEEVDGATVESIEIVEGVPEPRCDTLDRAVTLSRARSLVELAESLTQQVHVLLHAEWCVTEGSEIAVEVGTPAGLPHATLLVPALGWTVSIGRSIALTATELRLVTGYCELVDQLGQHLHSGASSTDPKRGGATPRSPR